MTRPAVLFCLMLGAAVPAAAQVTGPVPAPPPVAEAPAGGEGNVAAPALQSERARRLDELFSRLREADDPRQARVLEMQIALTLAQSGSDTADLLMVRATQAAQQQQQDLALSLLDSVIDLYPDYIEAWSRRATLYFARRELGRAVSDIEQVLRLEPRHFTAMVGLGMIFQQLGEDRQALAAFKRALEVNPHVERIPEIIRRLTPKVDGLEL